MAESNYPGDNQLASLVEAATAATDQEVEWSQNEATAASAHPAFEGEASHEGPAGNTYTAVRSGEYDPSFRSIRDGGELEVQNSPTSRKRKRGSDFIGVDHLEEERTAGQPTPLHPSLNRPSDVQSAAALFRTPSTKSKKYTRPPMSKLFASLQLLPEDFLHLQSAAKAYMLDEHHPERRDCVGQRGKTDSDMVKLKLWKCVQNFLDEEGNGEKFFSVNARKAATEDGNRAMRWPEDAQEIIKTCIPLLRRMVTNERQRQYAVEIRKGGGESKRDGAEPYAKKLAQQPHTAGIDDKENADTLVTDTIDIFDDGLIPNGAEAARWYDVYNLDSEGELDRILMKSGLPSSLFSQVVTKIDGHCRLYHRNPLPQCTDPCKTKLAERLFGLPVYQQVASTRDPWKTITEVFNVVLTHLKRIQYWDAAGAGDAADIGESCDGSARRASSESGSSSRQNLNSGTTVGRNGTNGQSQSSSLQLLIYILHQNKCILPSFAIPSSRCPNINSLRTQIEEHYTLRMLQEKGVMSLSAAPIKVWLPDGLVRIEDDGQWMVALLSADTVEWMGGQLRALLEI